MTLLLSWIDFDPSMDKQFQFSTVSKEQLLPSLFLPFHTLAVVLPETHADGT